MIPTDFKQMNKRFQAPEGLDASQVQTICAYEGMIARGNLEGETVIVTAWRPSPAEIQELINGRPIYISFLGGLFPHFPTTRFSEAANPGMMMREFECPNCRTKNSIVDQPTGSAKAICESCRNEIEIRFSTGLEPG